MIIRVSQISGRIFRTKIRLFILLSKDDEGNHNLLHHTYSVFRLIINIGKIPNIFHDSKSIRYI